VLFSPTNPFAFASSNDSAKAEEATAVHMIAAHAAIVSRTMNIIPSDN
jgi:hypothetical protein